MNYGQRADNALAALHAYKRQISADIATRSRIIRDAQRDASNITPHIDQLIRAPLTGLR